MRARNTSTRSKIPARFCGVSRDFNERQFARDRGRFGDVVHVDNIFELEQTGADAVPGLFDASHTSVNRESPGARCALR